MKKIILSVALSLVVIGLPAVTCIRESFVSCGNGRVFQFSSKQELTLKQCDALTEFILDYLC